MINNELLKNDVNAYFKDYLTTKLAAKEVYFYNDSTKEICITNGNNKEKITPNKCNIKMGVAVDAPINSYKNSILQSIIETINYSNEYSQLVINDGIQEIDVYEGECVNIIDLIISFNTFNIDNGKISIIKFN